MKKDSVGRGWQPLPASLKVFFVMMLILVVLSLFFLWKDSFFVMGFVMRGLLAQIVMVLLNIVAPIVLLGAMLKRASWTWRYAAGYLGFFIVNSFVAIISYIWLMPDGFFGYLWPSVLVGVFLNVVLIVFLLLFWRSRNYFQQRS